MLLETSGDPVELIYSYTTACAMIANVGCNTEYAEPLLVAVIQCESPDKNLKIL